MRARFQPNRLCSRGPSDRDIPDPKLTTAVGDPAAGNIAPASS